MEPYHKDQRRPLSFPNLEVAAFLDKVFKELDWKSPGGGVGYTGTGQSILIECERFLGWS